MWILPHASRNVGVSRVPTQTPTIDWSHPLAQGLIGAWLPGITLGQNLATSNGQATLKPGTGAQYQTREEGFGLRSSQASSFMNGTATAPFLTMPISAYWRGVKLGNPVSNNCYLLACEYNNAAGSPFQVWALGHLFAGTAYLGWNNNGTNNFSTGQTFTSNVVHGIGATFPGAGGTVRHIIDGKVAFTQAFGATNPTSTATSQITFGGQVGLTARAPNVVAYVGYVWNRVLTDAEHFQINRDPYSLFLNQAQWRGVKLPSVTLTPGFFNEGDTFYSHAIANTVDVLPDYWTDSDTFYSPTVVKGTNLYPPTPYRDWIDGNNFYPPEVTKAQSGSSGRPLIIGRNGLVTRYRKDHIK